MLNDPIGPLERQLADEVLEIASHTNMRVAARVFRMDEPRLSDLRHGRIARFSVERLIRILGGPARGSVRRRNRPYRDPLVPLRRAPVRGGA